MQFRVGDRVVARYVGGANMYNGCSGVITNYFSNGNMYSVAFSSLDRLGEIQLFVREENIEYDDPFQKWVESVREASGVATNRSE